MGHNKSSPERDIHSITGLLQGARKSSNKQFYPTHKRTRKIATNKVLTKYKEGNNRVEINDIETKKKKKKRSMNQELLL